MTQREDIAPAEPVDLMAGRIISLADAFAFFAFAFVTGGRWLDSVRAPSELGHVVERVLGAFAGNAE